MTSVDGGMGEGGLRSACVCVGGGGEVTRCMRVCLVCALCVFSVCVCA